MSQNSPLPLRKRIGCVLQIMLGFVILYMLFAAAMGPIGPGNKDAPGSHSMQIARQIGLAMFAYSNDHNQQDC